MSFGQTVKRVSAVLALILVVGIGVIYVFRGSITAWLLEPTQSIVNEPLWAPLDYRQNEYWRAAPQVEQRDWMVTFDDGFALGVTMADVFYIHPTGFYTADWNSSLLPNSYAEQMLDAMMISQASAFSECCDVWAPRYREATIYAFFDETMSNGPAAIDRAYVDVAAAFEFFLANRNTQRPFIIAGHSQGSAHAVRLLHDYVDGTVYQDQLVAAYIPGYSLSDAYLSAVVPSIPICQNAHDQGCIAHWDSAMPSATASITVPHWYPDGWRESTNEAVVCVNPVSWSVGDEPTNSRQHLGALSLNFQSEFAQAYANRPMPNDPEVGIVIENAYGAQCVDGLLRVSDIGPDSPFMGGVSEDGTIHVFDYNLFWLDIRRNALERTLVH